VQKFDILFVECTIVLFLQDGQFDFNQSLFLGRDTLFDILLETSQNVWSNRVVQFIDTILTLDIPKLFQKVILIIKFLGVNEIQERPEFPTTTQQQQRCE
jgi:hypothetical protein